MSRSDENTPPSPPSPLPSTPWEPGDGAVSIEILDRTPTAKEEGEFFLSPEDRHALQLANKKLELENEQFERDMSNREKFADRAYGVTQAWVGFVIVITLAQFAVAKTLSVGLTEKEFMVVVTTTTASVFGFWLLVGQYLFHRPGQTGRPARSRNSSAPKQRAPKKKK